MNFAEKITPSKRVVCETCRYVKNNCICSAITPQSSNIKIIILQHPLESKHAKNSAKLVNLCINHCQLVIGETCEDFAHIQEIVQEIVQEKVPQKTQNRLTQEQAQKQIYLVYPSLQAQNIEQFKTSQSKYANRKDITLIFIDASWRKAHKIWQLNPWLQKLPTLTFANAPKTRYQIRKHKKETSLSTLEAVAYCLEQIENADTSALHNAFDAMIAMHNRYRPSR